MSECICVNSLVRDFFNFLNDDILLGGLNDNDITFEVCFDCNLWNYGLKVESDDCDCDEVLIKPISSSFVSLLEKLERFLKNQLCDPTNRDFGYKSQLERLLYIIIDLKNKVVSIKCVDPCESYSILATLLSTLIETILSIISCIEYINSIITYHNNCGCSSIKVKEILIGKLINNITEIQYLLQDWYGIVVTFFYYSSTSAKSYIASYIPRHPINIPQPNFNRQVACVPCPPPVNQINQNCFPNPYFCK